MKKLMMTAAIAATMTATAQVLTPATGVANDHGYGPTRQVSVTYAPRTAETGYGYVDPKEHVLGVAVNSVPYEVGAYPFGTLTYDDSAVDYTKPGTYKVVFSCDNKEEYYGSAVMFIIVTEVGR